MVEEKGVVKLWATSGGIMTQYLNRKGVDGINQIDFLRFYLLQQIKRHFEGLFTINVEVIPKLEPKEKKNYLHISSLPIDGECYKNALKGDFVGDGCRPFASTKSKGGIFRCCDEMNSGPSLQDIKLELKIWENEFVKCNLRKANAEDIKLAPQKIKDAYKLYWKVKKSAESGSSWGSHFNKNKEAKNTSDNDGKHCDLNKFCEKIKKIPLTKKMPVLSVKQVLNVPRLNREIEINSSKTFSLDSGFKIDDSNKKKSLNFKRVNAASVHSLSFRVKTVNNDWLNRCNINPESDSEGNLNIREPNEETTDKLNEDTGDKQFTFVERSEKTDVKQYNSIESFEKTGEQFNFIEANEITGDKQFDFIESSDNPHSEVIKSYPELSGRQKQNAELFFEASPININIDVPETNTNGRKRVLRDFSPTNREKTKKIKQEDGISLKNEKIIESPELSGRRKQNADSFSEMSSINIDVPKANTNGRKRVSRDFSPTNREKTKNTRQEDGISLKNEKKIDLLEKKMKSNSVNDNFVRIDIKHKKFHRGKRAFSAVKYKRKKWAMKQKFKDDLGDESECFRCGQTGHWIKNCPLNGGRSKKDIERREDKIEDENEETSAFLTLEEAAALATGIKPKNTTENCVKVQVFSTVKEDLKPRTIEKESQIDDFIEQNEVSDTRLVEPLCEMNENGDISKTPKLVFDTLKKFGYDRFRPGQEETIMRILSGLSTLLVLSTGAGKSLCYQLPAYLYAQKSNCITLVISPLVSLMEDQVTGLPSCLKAVCLHTNLTTTQRKKSLDAISSGKVHIILISPEMAVGGRTGFSLPADLPPIAFACIDEAHCVSEWSHNFRPSYLRLNKVLRERFKVKCILALTATATSKTAGSVAAHLGIHDDTSGIIRGNIIPPNLCLSASRDDNKDEALINLLKGDRFSSSDSILVYCTRREQTERLATGGDLMELRRHIYANDVDRSSLRKLVCDVFPPCKCEQNETVSCCKHEVALPIEELIQKLDLKEENISTLLCYLELSPEKWIEILNPVYSWCKIFCYDGPKQLKTTSNKCPPLAAAIALDVQNGLNHDKSSSIEFPIVSVASRMGWDSGIVKREVKGLEWNQVNGKFRKSEIMTEFSKLAFHFKAPGNFSGDEMDRVLDYLNSYVVNQKKTELQQLESSYKAFYTVSKPRYWSCSDSYDREKSDQLKEFLKDYFDGRPITDEESISVPKLDVEKQMNNVLSDIRAFLGIYSDQSFTGRSVARIFCGIDSPCFPAPVWGRVRRFWRTWKNTSIRTVTQNKKEIRLLGSSLKNYFLVLRQQMNCKNTAIEMNHLSCVDSKQLQLLKEPCILVDSTDKVIKVETKENCHLMKNIKQGMLHRAFSVFLFNSNGDLLLQQRADVKITFPGYFTNTCCSHPLYTKEEMDEKDGMGVKRAARRRLYQELGISKDEISLDDFHFITRIHYLGPYNEIWGEHEIDHILFIQKNVQLDINLNEVKNYVYISKDQILDYLGSVKAPLTPWFELVLNNFLFHWWDNLDSIAKIKDESTIHHMNLKIWTN
uniref:Uncharacterized protein n=1 Tax=Strigamia maritima TaxID=126957 RepID=T1JDJ3_STRMM